MTCRNFWLVGGIERHCGLLRVVSCAAFEPTNVYHRCIIYGTGAIMACFGVDMCICRR